MDLVLGLPNLKILDCDVELKFVALVHMRRRGCVMGMCGRFGHRIIFTKKGKGCPRSSNFENCGLLRKLTKSVIMIRLMYRKVAVVRYFVFFCILQRDV